LITRTHSTQQYPTVCWLNIKDGRPFTVVEEHSRKGKHNKM